jgi:hypothetical protein
MSPSQAPKKDATLAIEFEDDFINDDEPNGCSTMARQRPNGCSTE